MGSGIFFPLAAIPFILIIIYFFYAKGHIKNDETKTYSFLIILNLIGLIVELFCSYACDIYYEHTLISELILKSYLVYLISWTIMFTCYVYTISKTEENKNKNIYKIALGIIVVFSVVIYFLPIDVVIDKSLQIHYTKGLCVNFSYFFSLIFVLYITYLLIRNYKQISSKKCLPIFLFYIIGCISIVIQYFWPQILLLTYAETIICIVMYFTIENPDIKMIEQLNIARDQADRANQSKSEFLSSMSHEIRTPLNAIVGFSQALQEENLPEQAQEEVKDIVRASESLLELVNGILDISKIEANKIEIVDGEYNIYEVLNDLTALSKARMGDKKLDFKPIFDKSIPPILYGDAVRVKQIILNLLTNAIKYTKEGEVIFRVSSIQNNSVCRLIISVEDTGIGIKKENIDQLFDKFQRLDLEKNKTIEGTGLGLAITKRLVDLMNGRIMVQSVYGKGSKFTVALDQKIIHKDPEQIKTENENNSSDIRDLTGKKVLIVDDNKLNLKVASRLIEKYNCEIKTLESGFECIDLIKSGEQFDIILMDDMMPNMSGVETFHKLKELDNFDTPVIALTANAISGMREKYIEEGFNDYLSKPIDKMELNKILNTYIKN